MNVGRESVLGSTSSVSKSSNRGSLLFPGQKLFGELYKNGNIFVCLLTLLIPKYILENN